jgi:hypothetical protein
MRDPQTPPQIPPQSLSFNASSAVAIGGALSGASIAVGVPWVLLANGQSLGPSILTALVILAMAIGGGVSLVSAFFGLVMPRHIDRSWADPERWRKWREFKREMEAESVRGWARRRGRRAEHEDED